MRTKMSCINNSGVENYLEKATVYEGKIIEGFFITKSKQGDIGFKIERFQVQEQEEK